MILDKVENVKNYMGISPAMDEALRRIASMKVAENAEPEKIDIGYDSFIRVTTAEMKPREMNFEFHRKYIDIHCPVSGEEIIGIAPISAMPEGTTYDAEKDVGHFVAEAVNVVTVPAGYFLVTFPEDAHRPGIGKEEHTILKLMVKVRA